MGAKFKIEENPTFSVKVGLDRAGGAKIEVLFTFNYFAQDELSLMQEEWQNRRNFAVEEAKDRIKTGPEWDELRIKFEVQELQDIIVGWDFDETYNDENLHKLINSMKSHYINIVTAFNNGLNPARLGN